jgi:primosomal protein N' (replication factor Y)
VAVAVPAGDGVFTWLVPEALQAGCVPGRRVQVPFGNRSLTGVVLGPAGPGEAGSLKEIAQLLDDGPLLTPEVVELCRFAAQHYLYPLGPAVKAALPPGIDLNEQLAARLSAEGKALLDAPAEASAPEQSALSLGVASTPDKDAGRRESAARTRALLRRIERGDQLAADLLRKLVKRGLVELVQGELKARVAEPRVPMAAAAPGAEARLAELKRAPRQRELLEYLLARKVALPLEEVAAAFPSFRALLKPLVQRALVVLSDVAPGAQGQQDAGGALWGDKRHTGTPAQEAALESLSAALGKGFQPFLLQGVTGSGKTWVYLELITKARAQGGTALVLVPEIALTPQLAGRFRARFGDDVAVLHSGLTDRERLAEWLRVQSGRAGIVVGARSAVFAPLANLTVIVVDEEHEPSYKQEERLRYHARDLALVRAQRGSALCLLGSATPSLESLRRVAEGKYQRLLLPERVDGRGMPAVTIVDRKPSLLSAAGPRLIGVELAAALRETLERKEQAILYLNRRGHARTLLCQSCGSTVGCPNCSVALVQHQHGGTKLKCHLCGHEEPPRDLCAICGGQKLLPLSGGTERLEEELSALLPTARVARLDRDSTSGSAQVASILARFARREIDVLAGTQMVAKGHDFPGVTLVGVLDADGPLHLPDFRAGERCLQLLAQVAGRAGRGTLPGRVIMQAVKPQDPVLEAASRHDAAGFAAAELERRQVLGFPPWTRLCALKLQGNVEAKVQGASERLAEKARRQIAREQLAGVDVLGPAAAPLARLRGKFRWQVLLRAREHGPLLRLARALVASHAEAGVELVADVDPVSLL